MKRTSSIVIAFALEVAAISADAGPPFSVDIEFLQLREKRDKALATFAEPINDGYRASLEQLLLRAVAKNDNDTAAKIQFELQSIGALKTSHTHKSRRKLSLSPVNNFCSSFSPPLGAG